MGSALFRSEFYTRMRRFRDENIYIYLLNAQTAIYDSEVKLFLKQGISSWSWINAFVRLECDNSAIDVILMSYEKYSTSELDLWFRNLHLPDK